GGIDAIGSREVESVEGLELREACLADALAHGGVVTRGLLDGEALVQVVLDGPALLAGLPAERLEAAREARHLEALALRAHEIGDDGAPAHSAPPRSTSYAA